MSNHDENTNLTIIDYLPDLFQNVPVNEEKFLFLFAPSSLNNEMIFQLKLETGVKLLSLLFLLEFFSKFKDIIFSSSSLSFIWSFILSIIFFLVCFYTYYSAKNPKNNYIKFAYLLSAIIISVRLLEYALKSFYLIIRFLYPFNSNFMKLDFLTFILGKGTYLFIYLYFIWIYYCFMIKEREKINPEIEMIFNAQSDFTDISNNNLEIFSSREKNE